MHVLDLDLDFFLDVIHSMDSLEGEKRLDYGSPWNEEATREFLEKQCGLDRKAGVPGALFEHHHEVFYYWRDLLHTDRLSAPFEIVHIDAHSDLGFGDASWTYILKDILQRPPAERDNPDKGNSGLNAGSFLAFAVASRWCERITLVLHPDWTNDIPYMYLQDFGSRADLPRIDGQARSSVNLQLKRYEPQGLSHAITEFCCSGRWDELKGLAPLELEPPVQVDFVPGNEFSATDHFDFITLTRSPTFTPGKSDDLIPVIAEYIETLSPKLPETPRLQHRPGKGL